MPSLPSSSALIDGSTLLYNVGGTIGTAHENTSVRVEQELLIHALLQHFTLYVPEWYVQATIPLKQNELLYWNIENRGSGAVYEINEAGRVKADGTDVPSITLAMGEVTMLLKIYGSIYRYTQRQVSRSKRDPVEMGTREQGIIVALQMDNLAKTLYDTGSQDIYPRAAITSDADTDWAATDVFNYPYLVKLETYLGIAGLRPPSGMKNFPMILPVDAQTNLLLDTTVAALLTATAARKDPMADIYLNGFIGSIRCFDLYTSNRLATNISLKSGAHTGARGYILTDEAIGCASLEDSEYDLPTSSHNHVSGSNPLDAKDMWEYNPRPVHVIHTDTKHESIHNAFRMLGAVAEKHGVGLKTLVAGRVVRFTYVNGSSTDIGAAAAPSLVQV